jgi:RNA polymerase sigma-70 factor (ECF subfamily)
MTRYAHNHSLAPTAAFLLPGFFLFSGPQVRREQARRNTAMTEAAELMERIIRRDEKALDILYDRFSKALFGAILCIVKRKEDAEEVLCEIFLQVWDKAPSYDLNRGALYTWLLSMARNRAIDKIRSKGYKNQKQEIDPVGGEMEMDDFAAPSSENALDALVLSERAGTVREALTLISPDQRTVLEIAYFEGYTQSQIAERLGLPLGTVKTRMRDGMKSLQTFLAGRIEWP